METLPFIGRDLAADESLVRVITACHDPHATAIAVISQNDGAHLVAIRSIRGTRQRNVAYTDLDDAMLDQVVSDLVDSVLEGGMETIPTEGAEASTTALEDLALVMAGSPAPRRQLTISGRGIKPRQSRS